MQIAPVYFCYVEGKGSYTIAIILWAAGNIVAYFWR